MKRLLTLWAVLGMTYVAIETLWRGYSHPSMFIVGGLCGLLVGSINQWPRFYRTPVILQSVIGAIMVLTVEFVAGCILNLWLELGVWDYSNQPGNILGQVCPVYGLLWLFLMPMAIWAEDTGRWLIWFYEAKTHSSQLLPPEQEIYTLSSVYLDFFTGQ